jgi:hypothetical protein
MFQEIERRAAGLDASGVHARNRQPTGPRGDEDEEQRRQQRRHRQQHERHGSNHVGHNTAAAAAGDDAEREADDGRERERGDGEDGGIRRALRNQVADRLAVHQRRPEVEPRGVRDPVHVLRADRFVEAVLVAELREALRCRVDAERQHRVVPRRQPREDERRGRHRDDQEQRERDATEEIGAHPT